MEHQQQSGGGMVALGQAKSGVHLMEHITNRIYARRKELVLTQRQMGELMQITQGYYSRIERGEVSLTLIQAVRLSEALQCSLSWLVFGKE
jgi:transcriptional regulator with XRE-family HTH domain